ncbi:MAG: heavy-metal-associated domain-containing protein [Deltaproteobacteria bacterium]|jgi:hypothetical protein|nr:heavy-metal-associated domain-containing protein [Deltaproteobacteria bacterium]
MIVSFVNGRIRARLTGLKGRQAPTIPTESLKGVNNLTINPRTGSVLLEYDPDSVSVETIAAYLEPFDPEGAVALRNPHLLKPKSIFGAPVEIPEDLLDESFREQMAKPVRKRGSASATAEMINLGTAFLSCVISAFWGSKKTHAYLGLGLGLLLGQHVWKHRRRMRPLGQMSIWEMLGLDFSAFLRPPAPPAHEEELFDETEEELSETLPSPQALPEP